MAYKRSEQAVFYGTLLIPGGGPAKAVRAGGQGVIRGFTKHGINQVISRDGVGVANWALRDAVINPTNIIQQTGGRLKYIGAQATVILNQEGKVISAWARTRAAWRIHP